MYDLLFIFAVFIVIISSAMVDLLFFIAMISVIFAIAMLYLQQF